MSQYSPLSQYETRGAPEEGEDLLKNGKVGCLIIAGGQGTRLGWEGPKGTYPLLEGKTLFQIHAEKIHAKQQTYQQQFPVAILTSPENHQETVDFFQKHGNFNLPDLQFFSQDELPFHNLNDQPLKQKGPDGNGHSVRKFAESPIFDRWKKQGIFALQWVPVDNPLAPHFSKEMAGLVAKGADMVLLAVKRSDPEDKLGVLMEENGKPAVVEYSEVSGEQKEDLKNYPLGNISVFTFSMEFVEKCKTITLPLHTAIKTIPGGKEPIKKLERFIFDLLPHTENAKILEAKRAAVFAPLKSKKSIPELTKLL